MTTRESLVLRISPTTTLTSKGLMSTRAPAVLGHQGPLKIFVQNTSAAVAQVLALIFQDAKAVPLSDGSVESSTQLAWEHYSRQVLLLCTPGADSDQVLQAGRAILQWCQAAVVAADVDRLPIRETPEFLAVEYLAEHGAQALACSAEQWDEFLRWQAEERTSEALRRRLDGAGTADPRPAPVGVIAPWPELLGAKLRCPGQPLDKLLRVTSDIIFSNGRVSLRIRKFLTQVALDDALVQAFEAIEPPSGEDQLTRGVRFQTEAAEYLFRAQREKLKSGRYSYVFRLLDTSRINLDAFFER